MSAMGKVKGAVETVLLKKRKVAVWTSRVVLKPVRVMAKPVGIAVYWALVIFGGDGRTLYCWVATLGGVSVVAVTVKGWEDVPDCRRRASPATAVVSISPRAWVCLSWRAPPSS